MRKNPSMFICGLILFILGTGVSGYYTIKDHQSPESLKNEINSLREEVSDLKTKNLELQDKVKKLEKVSSTKISFLDNLKCLTDNIYHEAAYEPEEGKIAVAMVTINRTHEVFRPKSICGVVYEPKQFSWTSHPRQINNNTLYQSIRNLAVRILTKKERSDIIGSDVTYYHATYVHPSWADEHEIAAQIGNHVFYKRAKLMKQDAEGET